jgi:hypothetical protein
VSTLATASITLTIYPPAMLVFARGLSVQAFWSRLVIISGFVYRGYHDSRGRHGCIRKKDFGFVLRIGEHSFGVHVFFRS